MSEWKQSAGGGIRFRHLTAEEEAKVVLVAEVEVMDGDDDGE